MIRGWLAIWALLPCEVLHTALGDLEDESSAMLKRPSIGSTVSCLLLGDFRAEMILYSFVGLLGDDCLSKLGLVWASGVNCWEKASAAAKRLRLMVLPWYKIPSLFSLARVAGITVLHSF